MVTGLPGFESIQSLRQALQYALYGPKTVQSNGCTLCDVWGGNVSMTIPFSFATLLAAIDKWDS
jgi:hypothetical protein